MPTSEREITEPVDLCDPDGRLNPAAVGWTRHPLHRANLRGWGRTKRWEYWGVVSPTHAVGLTLSSLDYAGVHGIWVLDRATGEETVRDAVVPLARGVSLPDRCGPATASARAGALGLEFTTTGEATTVRAAAPGVEIDLRVRRDPAQESLGVVVPWGPRRFQYTVKDLARPVEGRLIVGGRTVHIEDAFAVLDHGRGRWPYSVTWNWAAGSGAGGRGIQLGGRWTDGTGMTENALLLDGRLHKIGEELRWEYDRRDWLRPWRIHGASADVTFTPSHERVARTNLGVVASETHQCFGEFAGWACTDDGERVPLDGLVGWAEEARNRW